MAFTAAPATAKLLRADHQRRLEYVKRRQDILRSYNFCQKQAPGKRVRRAVVRVRRLVCNRLSRASRLPRLLWTSLRIAASCGSGIRRRMSPILNLRDRLGGSLRRGRNHRGAGGDSPGFTDSHL